MNDKVDIDGYFYFPFRDDLYLMVADEDLDIIDEYIEEKRVENVMISHIGGSSGQNLEFLRSHRFKKVNIYLHDKIDLSPLYHQEDIDTLILSDKRFEIDLNCFKKLECLVLDNQNKVIQDLTLSHLRKLDISVFKNTDLSFLSECVNLQELEIDNAGKLVNIEDVGSMIHLRRLDLYGMRVLKSLNGIQSCKKLESVSLEKCPVIEDLEVFSNNQELRTLYIIKCGTIKSLRFLERLPNLSLVYLEQTKVLDGYIPGFVRVF